MIEKAFHVDLVISSHNQYYERTYPISYNEEYEKETNKKVEPKPIITAHYKNKYPETNAIVFLTVGTAGDKLDKVQQGLGFYVNREAYHGFLNLEIANDGKRLVWSFDTNDGKIIDIIILFLILENLILYFNYN